MISEELSSRREKSENTIKGMGESMRNASHFDVILQFSAESVIT